ncbi:MAG: NYN domain-containing protein [Nitrospira sp.]|nr:NYN domain-containing protein [Nitrospira sp.]
MLILTLMANILIDGYNLMAKMDGLGTNLEANRERFIQRLSQFREQRYHNIIVVFDGERGGWITESHERTMGINIVFSRLGEKADDVIKKMVKEHEVEYIVITSDKEVASFAESSGHTAIPSENFIFKIMIDSSRDAGISDREEDTDYRTSTVRKKGNPRKLSKAARKRKQRLDSL